VEFEACLASEFLDDLPQRRKENYEIKMAAAGSRGHMGVVRVPSSGIEMVLSKNYLPVAQIRIRCKNGPQVSIDDIKLHGIRLKGISLVIYHLNPEALNPTV
jgi:hypothetical protein